MQQLLKSQTLEQQLRQVESPSPEIELLKECEAAILTLSGNSTQAESLLTDATTLVGSGRLGPIALLARIKLYKKDAAAALSILAPVQQEASAQPSSHAEYDSLIALVHAHEGKFSEALSAIDNAIALLRQTNDEALHLYCLRVKCQILRSLNRADAAELIEKRIGSGQTASASFDFLLPAYSLGN
jgi:ATP/maltotriose-dependent transcriptional regulator MalT